MTTDYSFDHIDPEEILPDPELHFFASIPRALKTCQSRTAFFSSAESDRIEKDIWQIIEQRDIKVLSLDVFDTYLLRNSKPEALRYLEMSELALEKLHQHYFANEKIESLTAEDLCLARTLGMQNSYRTHPLVQQCGEGQIEEVVAMQRIMLGLDTEVDNLMIETEIEYEINNLKENLLLTKIAKRFKDNGGLVILVSDMYLGENLITQIIDGVVDQPIHDHLFSSADLTISKRCGKIYPHIEEYLELKSSDFLHIGDSWFGDTHQAREAGWNALYLPISDSESFERKQGLADFINAMDEKELDTRSWAKV